MLVHGFGEDASIWEPQIQALQAHCMLLVPVLRGIGTAADCSLPSSIEEMATDLLSILDAENISACIMMGHPMGGYITLAFAALYPERLLAFGLIHSTAYADTEEKKAIRRKAIEFMSANGAAAFLKTTIPNLFGEKFISENNDQVNTLIEKSVSIDTSVLISHYEAMIVRPDRTEVLTKSKVPMLMIIGKQDKAVNPADAEAQSKLNPLCHTAILNIGHMAMLEAPEQLNMHMRMFIDFVSKL